MSILYENITGVVLKAAYEVFHILGSGFLEKVYENALVIEIRRLGLCALPQQSIKVLYKGQIIGDYIADIVVADKVIVEVKSVKELAKVHEVQLVNYLKATQIEVGLIINFGEDIDFRRRVLTH